MRNTRSIASAASPAALRPRRLQAFDFDARGIRRVQNCHHEIVDTRNTGYPMLHVGIRLESIRVHSVP